MGWFKQLYLSWIILSANVSCQELTSTLREGNHTCPGDEVIFTCTIRGSSGLSVFVLTWSSAEYISGSLQLSTTNMLGDIETSTGVDGSITATATVTNNANANGERMLESTLRITAVQASVVTCSGTSGGPESIEFTISAVPGVPQRISTAEISRPSDGICIILVTWDRPANSDASDIDQYIIYVPSRNIREVSSSAISTFTVLNCGDDVRVQVAAVNRVGCVGMNSSEVQPILLDIPTAPTANESATTEGGSTSTSNQVGAGAIAGIAIGSTIIYLLCVLVLSCYLRWSRRRLRNVCHSHKDRPDYGGSLPLNSRGRTFTRESLEPATNPKELSSITVSKLIKAARNNKHEEPLDELKKQVDKASPEDVKDLLYQLFEALQHESKEAYETPRWISSRRCNSSLGIETFNPYRGGFLKDDNSSNSDEEAYHVHPRQGWNTEGYHVKASSDIVLRY